MKKYSHLFAAAELDRDPLLNNKEAAKYLTLQPCTLDKWRSQGRGPEPTRIGTRSIRYRKSALDTFIQGGGNA
ncbi:helix-turn-helix transcriptional regulator [Silicimonas sp. MF1-12-2]|uniref:helix-turn-helix transcriptional regulator n=1 Tax=Silicimonas sp. MF1-12-2 TaxID=3384793 RepID=UPI0039B6D373